MAFPVVLKTYIEKIDKIINQFLKYHSGIVYKPGVSLAILIDKRNTYDKAVDKRNQTAIAYSESIDEMYVAQNELSQMESAFLLQTGAQFTKDSNEYVWAGGTRQSDAIEKRKATLEKNQRLEKLRVEAEAVEAKAEKERVEAEMVALKAEVERFRAERDNKK